MMKQENLPQLFEDDSIDMIVLLKQIYQGRLLIILSVIVSAILGITVALTRPNVYTVGATFITQTGSGSKPSSSLSNLASIAGINLGVTSGGSDIPPTLYPQIISSIPYKLDLLNQIIDVNGNAMSLRSYLQSNSRSSFLVSIKKYTVGLPSLISSTLRQSTAEEIHVPDDLFFQIEKDDHILFGSLDSKLKLSFNVSEGFVTLKFTDHNKYVAAQIAESARLLLQKRVIAFKNQLAREVLDFTVSQFIKSKSSFEILQDSLAIFRDQNLNISSSLYQNKLDRLERDLSISSSVLQDLSVRVENAKLQVNKDTPIFTIIEPTTVPFAPSAPNRIMIVVIWIFMGLILSTGFVVLKNPMVAIISSIKD